MSKTADNPVVEVGSACKRFAPSSRREAEVLALRDVSFALQRGEFYVFLGASGSGKTTQPA